jgi:hypothetical protein
MATFDDLLNSDAPLFGGSPTSASKSSGDLLNSNTSLFAPSPEAGLDYNADQLIKPQPPSRHPDRGLTMDVLTAPVAGLADLFEIWARGARTGNVEPSEQGPVDQFADWVIKHKEELEKSYPYVFAESKASTEGGFRNWIYQGVRSAVPSVGAGIPGLVAGSAVGGLPGAVLGFAASGGTAFGFAEYDRFAEDIKKYNDAHPLTPIPDLVWKDQAVKSAFMEGGLEFASDAIEALMFKFGRLATEPMKENVRSILKKGWKQGAKDFAKAQAVVQPTEVGTEMAQNYLETQFRQEAGLPQEMDPWDAAVASIGPSVVTSLIIGSGAHLLDVRQRGKVMKALVDPSVDVDVRFEAAKAVAQEIEKFDKANDTQLAPKWGEVALARIANGEAIPVDENVLQMQDVSGYFAGKERAANLEKDVAKFNERGEPVKEDVPEPEERPEDDKQVLQLYGFTTFEYLKKSFLDKGFDENRATELAKMVMGAKSELKAPETTFERSDLLDEKGQNILKEVPKGSTRASILGTPDGKPVEKIPLQLQAQAVLTKKGEVFSSRGAVLAGLKLNKLAETHVPFQLGERQWVGLPKATVDMLKTTTQLSRISPTLATPQAQQEQVAKLTPTRQPGILQPTDLLTKHGVPFTSRKMVVLNIKKQGVEGRYVPVKVGDKQWVGRRKDFNDMDKTLFKLTKRLAQPVVEPTQPEQEATPTPVQPVTSKGKALRGMKPSQVDKDDYYRKEAERLGLIYQGLADMGPRNGIIPQFTYVQRDPTDMDSTTFYVRKGETVESALQRKRDEFAKSKEKTNDRENADRVPGEVGVREEPVQAEPERGAGEGTPAAGGVLQGKEPAQSEGEGGPVQEVKPPLKERVYAKTVRARLEKGEDVPDEVVNKFGSVRKEWQRNPETGKWERTNKPKWNEKKTLTEDEREARADARLRAKLAAEPPKPKADDMDKLEQYTAKFLKLRKQRDKETDPERKEAIQESLDELNRDIRILQSRLLKGVGEVKDLEKSTFYQTEDEVTEVVDRYTQERGDKLVLRQGQPAFILKGLTTMANYRMYNEDGRVNMTDVVVWFEQLKAGLAEGKLDNYLKTDDERQAFNAELVDVQKYLGNVIDELLDRQAKEPEVAAQPEQTDEERQAELDKLIAEQDEELPPEDDGTRFAKSQSRLTQTKADVEGHVQPLLDTLANGPDVQVVQSIRDLPLGIRALLAEDPTGPLVAGVTTAEGEVYLVADNIKDEREAVQFLLHEVVGHYGLRQFLGKDADNFFKQLYYANFKTKAFREFTQQRGFETTTEEQRLEAAEEYLAYMDIAGIDKPSVWQRAYNLLRAWLRKLKPDLEFTDAELHEILANARQLVSQGNVAPSVLTSLSPSTRHGFTERKAPAFYSQLTAAVERGFGGVPKKVENLRKWLGRHAKPAELKWVGMEQFLEGKKVVSRQELLDFLRQHEVSFNEVLKDELQQYQGENIQNQLERAYDAEIAYVEEYGDIVSDEHTRLLENIQELEGIRDNPPEGTRYSGYKEPGGENYRELLLQWNQEKRFKEIWTNPDGTKVDQSLIDSLPAEAYEKTREGFLAKGGKVETAPRELYQSPHWAEPNVLAHVRFDERTDSRGRRVLFIEEVQSDWLQDAKKHGFKKEPGLTNQDVNDILTGGYQGSGVARAPFLENWHELTFKRMLRWAAEHDFDAIAWTTGKQQADRYNLAQYVDSLEVFDLGEGAYDVVGFKNNADVVNKTVNSKEELADVIGKELAVKAVLKLDSMEKPESGDRYKAARFSGLDLTIGGQGMRTFYDQKLKRFVEKYVKQWGGKVQQFDLSEQDNNVYKLYKEGDSYIFEEPSGVRIVAENLDGAETALFEALPDLGTTEGNKRYVGEIGGVTFTPGPDFDTKFYDQKIEEGAVYTLRKGGQPKMTQPGTLITPAMKRDVLVKGQPMWAKVEGRLLEGMSKTMRGFQVKDYEKTWIPNPKAGEWNDKWQNYNPEKLKVDRITAIHRVDKVYRNDANRTFTLAFTDGTTRTFSEREYQEMYRKRTAEIEQAQRKLAKGYGTGPTRFAKRLEDITPDTPPRTVKEIFSDEAKAILRTLASQLPKNLPSMSVYEKLLASPEWYSHPVLQQIVDHAIARHDRYYELFNRLNDVPGPAVRGMKDLISLNMRLKHKGLTRSQVLVGQTSADYKLFQRIIDDGDTKVWEEGYPEDRVPSYEDHLKSRNTPEDVLELWRLHREAYDRALDLLMKPIHATVQAIDEEAARNNEKPKYPKFTTLDEGGKTVTISLKQALDQMGQLRGSYAPRLREYGDWVVKGKKGDEEFRAHKSLRKSAESLRLKMEHDGWVMEPVTERERLPEDVYGTLRVANTAQAIESALKGVRLDAPELKLKFQDQLLQEVADLIRIRGFRSSMVRRRQDKLIHGYILDPNERFARYINNISAGIAKAETAEKMFKALVGHYEGTGENKRKVGGIDASKEKRAYDVATTYIEEQLRNTDATDRFIGMAKSVATFKYLGFNARSIMVNLLAMLTTAPTAIHQYAMGGKGSLAKVGVALSAAGKDYTAVMRGKRLTNKNEQEFMDEIKLKGYDDQKYTREAMGTIERTHGKIWNKLLYWAMYAFGKTEQWNRGTTMLAAYRIIKKNNPGIAEEDARAQAHRVSDRAHGTYGKATLPTWALGKNPAAKLGQLLYTYQKFSHNYLQMLYDVGVKKHNIKGFLFGLLSPVILGGLSVVPMKNLLFGVVGVLLKMLGVPLDPEKWFWDKVRGLLGRSGEKVTRHGALGAAGVDVSTSLSIGVGIPQNMSDYLGVAGGIGSDVADAYHFLKIGEGKRAAEKLLPNAGANIVRAYREINGLTTSKGRRVWNENGEPYVPSTSEVALRVAGFRSTSAATMAERTQETREEQKNFKDRAELIYERYRNILADPKAGDKELQQLSDDIVKYNEMVVKYGKEAEVSMITRSTLKRQARDMFAPNKRDRAVTTE